MSKEKVLYHPDDIVWAKMKGYPHWPARVLPYPSERISPSPSPSPNHYFVLFYGTHQVAWMASKDLLPYHKYREKFRSTSKSTLKDAVWEAEEDPSLELSNGCTILDKYDTSKKKGGGRKKRQAAVVDDTMKKVKSEPLSDEEKQPTSPKALETSVRKRLRANSKEKSSGQLSRNENPPTKKVKEELVSPSRQSPRFRQATICSDAKGSLTLDQALQKEANESENADISTARSHKYGTRHKAQNKSQSLPSLKQTSAKRSVTKTTSKSSKEAEKDKSKPDISDWKKNSNKDMKVDTTSSVSQSNSNLTQTNENSPVECVQNDRTDSLQMPSEQAVVKNSEVNSSTIPPVTTTADGSKNDESSTADTEESVVHADNPPADDKPLHSCQGDDDLTTNRDTTENLRNSNLNTNCTTTIIDAQSNHIPLSTPSNSVGEETEVIKNVETSSTDVVASILQNIIDATLDKASGQQQQQQQNKPVGDDLKDVPGCEDTVKLIPVTGPPVPPKPPKKKRRHPPKQLILLPTMNMVDALKVLNYNLKISLVIGYQDSTQALHHLRDLLDLTFTSSDVEEVKDLVFTIRKLKHFKHNARVRARAEELYSKIKSMYVIGEVRPNPRKGNGKHKPQTVIRRINEATATKNDSPSDMDVTSNHAKDEVKKDKDENVRRSQRSHSRVNYSELSGETQAKEDDDQEVPSTQ